MPPKYRYARVQGGQEVYLPSGRCVGVVRRIDDHTRYGTIQRWRRFLVNGVRYLNLEDAADALVRMERSEG